MMLVSQRIGLPTLNGETAWQPPGWRLHPGDAGYQDHARDWIAAKGLTAVCSLILPAGPWARFQ